MTYIEKLMKGIKFDREVIFQQEEQSIRDQITAHPHTLCCPGDVFEGAPKSGKRQCTEINTCVDCWKRKVTEAAEDE